MANTQFMGKRNQAVIVHQGNQRVLRQSHELLPVASGQPGVCAECSSVRVDNVGDAILPAVPRNGSLRVNWRILDQHDVRIGLRKYRARCPRGPCWISRASPLLRSTRIR